MLLIYVPKLTNRLGYTLKLIFNEILGIDFKITTNAEDFIAEKGFKISYGDKKLGDEIFIKSSRLLFSTAIEMQDLDVKKDNERFSFFHTYSPEAALDFDIFAATFYLVSRYEEYLPHKSDKHNRFMPENSVAYAFGFLNKPVVNFWVKELKEILLQNYPALRIGKQSFRHIPTFDIDNFYAYSHKGFVRTILGLTRSLLRRDFKEFSECIKVHLGKMPDPFDTYPFIIESLNKYSLESVCFILFAQYGKYDRNISTNNIRFCNSIKHLADYIKIGIHPSYASFDDPKLLKKEVEHLAETLHKPIKRSRAHFIRIRLPNTYREFIENEIIDDFSMGYPSMPGFRAGICTPFHFYDLGKDYETKLRIHPFAIMDGSLSYYLKTPVDEVLQHYTNLIDEVKAVDGSFYCIWHNETLSEKTPWVGWKKIYEQVLDYASKLVKNEE